jgi:arsenate reductase
LVEFSIPPWTATGDGSISVVRTPSFVAFAVVASLVLAGGLLAEKRKDDVRLLMSLESFVEQAIEGEGAISRERRRELDQLARESAAWLKKQGTVELVFVCTHNSRRSQMAQVWTQVAAAHYRVPGLTAYSGGTETTACNARTVQAFKTAGLAVEARRESENPVYRVRFSERVKPLQLFSKVYYDDVNPREDFFAVICCSDADMNCPVVEGTAHRYALHYLDPRLSDETPAEAETYMERNRQIACEMFYLVSRVAAAVK